MTTFENLRSRNERFAATVDLAQLAMPDLTTMPERLLLLLTCVDPRVEPAGFLGIRVGDAGVLRNAGGRVDTRIVEDIAYLAMRLRVRLDVAVVHHTQCGTGLLAEPVFRASYAERMKLDPDPLTLKAVVDPRATVRHDTIALLTNPLLQGGVLASVSGHVLHLETGLVETVVEPAAAVEDVHHSTI
jgi:carbonic anhydrase